MTSQLKKIKWVRLLFLAQDKELETHDYIITAIVLYLACSFLDTIDGEFMNIMAGRPNDLRLNGILLTFFLQTVCSMMYIIYFIWLKRLIMKEVSLQILLCEEVIGKPDATNDFLHVSPRSRKGSRESCCNKHGVKACENETFFQLRTVLIKGINPDDLLGKSLEII